MAVATGAAAPSAMEVEGPLAASMAGMGVAGTENGGPSGAVVLSPKAEVVSGKPADMEQSFYDQLVSARIPQVLIHYMSDQYINCLTDFRITVSAKRTS